MNDEIAKFVRDEIATLRADVMTRLDEITARADATDTATTSQQNQLALSTLLQSTRQTMALVGEKIQADVYADIVNHINTTIAPKVNQAMAWIGHNMEDGDVTVDAYRREVEQQECGDALMITDGTKDKRIISANVRTYFQDSSSDEY